MLKRFCSTTILASFILSPAFADSIALSFNSTPLNSIMAQQKILLVENTEGLPNDDSSSRGRVTQGVIGAEAEENRKLVSEESAAEQKEQKSRSNIRSPDGIEHDVDPITSETE